MSVLKGDIVRTNSGETGEVTDVWGLASTFLRLKKEDGKTKPIFESDVIEIIKRPKSPSRGRR
ncbi:hypothetical protein [Paenibacillus sp. DMB20]|uniref:hypothetical protein n=1 Tax=Paenibacillus sp. DMB20 TaxID=1642570 RepID=UPI000627BF00|nr:hypothetical protein [Paenibacillus sp. DMB20]KKO51983.1 hypothetical protein XI25_21130 [Paenibacillus sp. DMB20]